MTTQLLTRRKLQARYGGKCAKTIDRWVEAGILPAPMYINEQRYWYEHEVEKRDRERQERAAQEVV